MYKVIESKIELEGEERTVTVYGLQHEDGTEMKNISPNKTEAERLAEYCTKNNVSSWSLEEIVSDMLDTLKGLEI